MKKKIYLASNVGMEYFLFLSKVLENTDFQIRTFYYLEESEYRNMSRGSLTTRFFLRLKMYLFYPIYLLFCGVLFSNNSIFIVSSGTFYTPYLMQFFLKFKNIKVIQLLYDLYPDILEASKMIKKDSFTSNFIGKISKNNQTKCFGTVYLGSFLKEHAEKRWGKSLNSSVIDIATDVRLYNDHLPRENKSQKITIHYGGQLGQAHDVDSIIECLKLFYKTNLTNNFKFNFAISGSKSKYFRNKMRGFPIQIEDTVKGYEWRAKIQNYHIGLVGLVPAGASICLPSKTYSMMAGGLAIISVCPIWSDLSKLISENDCGWIVNNSAEEYLPICSDMKSYLEKIYSVKNRKIIAENFIATLEDLKQTPDLIYQKRRNAYNNVRASYDFQDLSNKWNVFLKKID